MTNKSLIYVVCALVLLSFALAAEVKVTCGSASVKQGDPLTCSVSLGQSIGQISTYSFVINPGSLFTITDATCTADGYTGAYGSSAKKLSCATGGKKTPTQLANIILSAGNALGDGKVTLDSLSILDYDGKSIPGLTIKSSDTISVSSACTPKCDGKVCGPDTCGGTCGACPAGQTCSADGISCMSGCKDTCPSVNQFTCSVDGKQVINCFDYNTDGCLELGTYEQCVGNTVCLDGKCTVKEDKVPSKETICNNKIDDDADGFTDCADTDCDGKVANLGGLGYVSCCQSDATCLKENPKRICGKDNYCAWKTIGNVIDEQLTELERTAKTPTLGLLSHIAQILKAWFAGG